MALDLFLGIIKKNWARDAADGSPQAAAPPATLVLTADEKDWLGRIATLKMRAESGDRKSRKQWKRLARKANALRTKARKGDPRASRMIAVLDQSGLLGSVQKISGDAEPRDQDIVEKLILRAGNATGWPTMISRDRYADYERRAGQGDQRSREVMAILTRYINAGRVKVSDGMKSQISRYPIGASLCADDLEAAADGGSCERAALARRLGVRTARSNVGDRQSDAFALQIATAPTTAALFSPHTAARADSSPKAPPKVLADPGGIADFLHDKQIIDAQAKKEADESDKRYRTYCQKADPFEKLILRENNNGRTVYITKEKYADYKTRAGQGDQRAKEMLAILDRCMRPGNNPGHVEFLDPKYPGRKTTESKELALLVN